MGFLFNEFIGKFQSLIRPRHPIVALEIKDVALRIASLDNGIFKKEGIQLEPGIIEDGEVKDKDKLIERLKQVKKQFFFQEKVKISVIAIIPSAIVYTKVFSLPALAGPQKEEAVSLNLQSISPIDFNSAYSDSELLSESTAENKLEFLGAFASKKIIDTYTEVLEKSGFAVVAIEFPALAIARALQQYASGIDFSKPYVAVNVSSDGIDFMVLKNGKLYFDYFSPWKLARGDGAVREIPFEDFKQTIISEIKKISTFYGGHWGGSLNNLVLITQALDKEIAKFIEEQFHFNVAVPELREFRDLPFSWLGIIGSAYRGILPRAKDALISLAPQGTEEGYLHAQTMFFIKIWRNALIAVFGFLLLLFIGVDSFLAITGADIKNQIQQLAAQPGGPEIVKLQEKAENFNNLIAKTSIAKEQSKPLSPIFAKLNELADGIIFTKLSVNVEQKNVFLTGNAQSQSAVIDFKNRLAKEGYANINLPLSKLETNPEGKAIFTINFSFP